MLELLRAALRLGTEGNAENGLLRFAGTWSARDLAAFEAATAVFEQIDEELWK